MKVPTKVVFAFDYEKSSIPALADKMGLILWGVIRTNHIVSQYFNDNVMDVVHRIEKEEPKDYAVFKNIITTSGLHIFGTICKKSERGFELRPVFDDEYWQGMWEYLMGEKSVDITKSLEAKKDD